MPMPLRSWPRAGWRSATGLPSISDRRPSTPRSTPKSASSSSRWPWPSRPPRPTTSPAPTASEMSLSRSAPRKVRAPRAPASRRSARAGFGGNTCAVFAADHQLARSRRRSSCPPSKVATWRPLRNTVQVVGELRDLVHAVRDVERAPGPRARSRFSTREDPLDVGGGQRRGRLVEDQDRGLRAERLGDLDQLPARQRQVLHQRAADGCRSQPTRGQQLPRRRRRCAARSIRPKRVGGLVIDDVVGDRQVGDQRQFLEDADDAGRVAAAGLAKRDTARRRAHARRRRAGPRRP